MTYVYNLEDYAGKQPESPFKVSNKPSDVVERMAQPFSGTGRNITSDNFFADFNLIHKLKKQKLTYVGTATNSKRELPLHFLNVNGRKQYSSMFGLHDGKVLASYIPCEKKNVILVYSLNHDDAIDPASGPQKKPEIIMFSSSTKSGVDTADKMCVNYNVYQNNKR